MCAHMSAQHVHTNIPFRSCINDTSILLRSCINNTNILFCRSQCTASCGVGSRRRARSVSAAATGAGARCAHLAERVVCGVRPCPIDCVLGAWSEWTLCSTTCAAGELRRYRPTAVPALGGGAPCTATVESRPCLGDVCPIDCQVSAWTEWGQCSASCAPGGKQLRTRRVIALPFGGTRRYICLPRQDLHACFNRYALMPRCPPQLASLYSCGLYRYGPYNYGLYGYGQYSYGLYSYGLCNRRCRMSDASQPCRVAHVQSWHVSRRL